MKVALLVLLSVAAIAQTPISAPDASGNRVLVGSLLDNAIRVTCVNPTSHATESCAGGGGGGGDATEATLSTRLADATFTGRVGEVQASPTANTLLGRIKAMEDALAALLAELQQKTEPANTQTISGAVTGPLTDAELRAVAVPVSGTFFQGTQPVSAAALPLPAGASTSANQATEIASLASLDGKAPALGQALAAASVPVVLTAAQVATLTPPAAITGFATETTLSTLNAKVTAVNTGAVVVSSSALPSGASTLAEQQTQTTALQLLDDTVATTASAITTKGVAAAGTDGTNARVLKTDTGGELQVDVLTMPTVAVTGTFWQATQPVSGTVTSNAGTGNFTVVQGTGTNLHMVCDSGCTPGGSTADNSAFTFGTTSLNPAGFVFDDTAPNAVTENNIATPRMAANRVPYSTIRDAAGNERGVNVTAGNALLVDASATTQPVSGTVTAAQATAANLNATVVGTGTFAVQAAQSGTWNITNVSGTVSLPTGASTLAEQQTQTTALQLIDDTVGTVAAAIPTKGLGALGTDGTNGRILKTDTGGELQIDVLTLPAIPAGTNNIGDVDILTIAAGDNNIGNVDIVTMPSAVLTAETTKVIGTVRTLGNGGAVLDAAIGAAPPANGVYQIGLGSGATGGLVIAPTICDQWASFNGTASADLVTGVSGRRIYVCSGSIQMNGGANTVSFVSGTGTVCATSIEAVPGFDGATTAANGYSFAANSGMTWAGANGAAFARTTTTGENLCILVGSATRVVGGFSYAIY